MLIFLRDGDVSDHVDSLGDESNQKRQAAHDEWNQEDVIDAIGDCNRDQRLQLGSGVRDVLVAAVARD